MIFSRRMKSSSSAGPRAPALSEFWLSAIATPWLVVSTCPLESTRTRSSVSMVALTPSSATVPVLPEKFCSDSVLPVGSLEGGLTLAPTGGVGAFASPYSSGLVRVGRHAAGERLGVDRLLGGRVALARGRRGGSGRTAVGVSCRGACRIEFG